MPLNPESEPTKFEQARTEVYLHSEEVGVALSVITLIVAFTVLGAPLTVAGALLLGVALVYLFQFVAR